MRSVFLVGFMGAGKSSVGAALAVRLGYRFIDLDEEISGRFGATIPEVFRHQGEAAFRAVEGEELARCADLTDVVVATGGGAFCIEANRQIIHDGEGVSVYLELPWEELGKRLEADHLERPKYDDVDQARRLYEERLPHYRRAMVTVSLEGLESSDEIAERILRKLGEASCAT
jgi:shikimate kinase